MLRHAPVHDRPCGGSGRAMNGEPVRLSLPLGRPRLAELHAGDACLLLRVPCTRCAMPGTCASWPSSRPRTARCPTAWTARPSSTPAPRPRPPAGRSARSGPPRPAAWTSPPRRCTARASWRPWARGAASAEVRDACCATGSVYFVARGRRCGLPGQVRGIIGDGGVRRLGNRGAAPHRGGGLSRVRGRGRPGASTRTTSPERAASGADR